MNYDVKLTPAVILALASWVARDMTDVELAVDDRMLVAEQGDERMAWDTDGSPGSEEYLAVAPLDPTGNDRLQIVYVVRPHDMMEDVAAFVREEDAEAFAATYDNVGDVERVTICGPKLAAEMIVSRSDDEDGEEESKPYTVGEVSDPGVMARFATADEASQYIADTFPASDVESGRYCIDGPEES